ncbi:MAG: hypothetical protein JXP34_17870 [Planctomycetes bacterium]|nr:hypothetical protein [Planctomycetota bacterium]
MVAIVVLSVTIIISAVIVKIGTVALRMTGIDEHTASFQALSAFTGTGFTTQESEKIVSHPARRRIVRIMMILGNAGLATVIATSILSFGSGDVSEVIIKVGIVVLLGLLIYKVAIAKRMQAFLDRWIQARLARYTDIGVVEFQEILRLDHENGIARVELSEGNPILGKTLRELALGRSGVLVLAVQRGMGLVPNPGATTRLEKGDRLVCYGRPGMVRKLAQGEYAPPPVEMAPYHEVLALDRGYGISRVDVNAGGVLEGATLEELALPRKRILVLAIQAADGLLPAPNPRRRLAAGETLVCYGPLEEIRALAEAKKAPEGKT